MNVRGGVRQRYTHTTTARVGATFHEALIAMMTTSEPIQERVDRDFDLAAEHLEEDSQGRSLVERLETYRILPPSYTLLSQRTLEQIEMLFVTWFELQDDASRRSAVSYVFSSDPEVRAALLAIVPLYYDTMFFDEHTPTRDLVEIALVAHAKWRRWLAG